MKIFRFDSEVGKQITAFGSINLSMSKIIRSDGEFHIGCMHLAPSAVVGGHVAPSNQLFLVAQGEVQVRSGSGDHNWTLVNEGQAVYWMKGEWHETKSIQGAMAFVVENLGNEPENMPEA
ncbi:hypothetical protein SY83_05675 [Paenibacillus swuensis]|uniref:Cupin n=1 Tax=Paenibacillus swuensis TaxID=1178515 RepID=A0A172TFP8_9BACL|nr:cupin domain-containing protein [Paenibacillus swuensis]ANE45879.1 hypothetical protein SY83_05675 [Paenibacillus swuensis]